MINWQTEMMGRPGQGAADCSQPASASLLAERRRRQRRERRGRQGVETVEEGGGGQTSWEPGLLSFPRALTSKGHSQGFFFLLQGRAGLMEK